MARPRVIQDEVKETHVYLGKRVWLKLFAEARQKETSVSALMREMAEERYGQQQKG